MSAAVAQRSPGFHRLVWLMPAAFAIHIVEEYTTGFPGWVSQTLGGSMTGSAFLANNALFMAILLSLTAWASLRPSVPATFALLCWASGNLFWNFVFHVVTTVPYARYSPGLVTAAILYLPVSVLVARSALGEAVISRGGFAGAVSIGAMLMLLVMWIGL
ncbi:HXXEE domain-containing protein [Arenibaculum pallidiluteum]|uniref:HXXEE domain-containing protein n=1 Tax=Arenibaculum pallidiluteum TaxID=2812559 RepID=UPI001A95CA42|nr:HXXEE domain-containing protein [Arenibaculum pallidiluteum]